MTAGQVLLSLLAAALKAGLLLALAAALVAALGRAPARARHSVWALALAGALLLPLMAPWVPDLTIAALPVPALASDEPAPAAGAVAGPRPAGRFAPPADTAEAIAAGLRPASAVNPEAVTRSRWAGLAEAPPAMWLLAAWLLGIAASGALFLRSLAAARRLERRASAAGGAWLGPLDEARRRVGLRRPVRLLLGAGAATPMTWGWLRPVVLLPAAAARWSPPRRRVVLLHELVHVRRNDWLVRLLARLVCSVYWFNPLAWLAARRLAVEQELACDERVVALGTRPSSYARHLLAIARSLGPATRTPAHALDMARRSQMEGRLMSILDGGKRTRGGRGLAILALAIVAGLVPALAAIEPWAPEETTETAPAGGPRGAAPPAGAEGVARALGELAALEKRMEPFEAELEALRVEMEPIEVELEGFEVEMEPIEVELEGFEVDLEPFEEMLAAVESEMRPFEERLEAIGAEIEPFERRLEAIEVEMRPFEVELEAFEAELEPFADRLEAVEAEIEPLARQLEALSEELEPLARAGGEHAAEMERVTAEMGEVQRRMEPLHRRMSAIHQEMRPVYERMSAAHRGMEPLHERMAAIHAEMDPVHERMSAVHRELEPLYERLSAIHEQMRPVHERMGAVHERMEPIHQRMGERHEAMEPFHRKMGEIHQRMEPLHEEMGRRFEQLERELAGLVERMLAVELAGVTAAGTDYAPAAGRVVDAVSLRVDGGTLRLRASAAELRRILDDALGDRVTASAAEFAAAADRFARALGDLEIAAG